MAYITAIVAQKGGVGKSTLARMLAVEIAKGGLSVKIADLDTLQTTSVVWSAWRAENGHQPTIRVEAFGLIEDALKETGDFDFYILDGAPHTSAVTLKASLAADMVIIPTNEAMDDLLPAVHLANNLYKNGVKTNKIAFAFNRTDNSAREIDVAREYLSKTPYCVLDGDIPNRSGYKIAMDKGLVITETTFKTLRQRAEMVAQGIVDAVVENSTEKGR